LAVCPASCYMHTSFNHLAIRAGVFLIPILQSLSNKDGVLTLNL
jgi:hypothetical protein